MFEDGDVVQLTEDSCEYYEKSRPYLADVCGCPLTVIDGWRDCDDDYLYRVRDDSGETFSFYEFELEIIDAPECPECGMSDMVRYVYTDGGFECLRCQTPGHETWFWRDCPEDDAEGE